MQFTKRMGRTVYRVHVHGSENESDSSFEDALVRLIVDDPLAFSDRSAILKSPPVSRCQPERIDP